MKMFKYLCCFVLLAGISRAQTEINFNNSGELYHNFQTPVETNLYVQSLNGGLDDSGSITMPPIADNQFWGLNQGFSGQTDHVVSLYFQTSSIINTGYISIGIMADVEQTGVQFPSGGDYLGVTINAQASDFEVHGEGAFNFAGGDLTSSLVADSWYYMELTFDWQFNQTYGLQFRAYESDASGNLGASLVTGTTFSTSLESDVADDAEVFNFFGGYNTNEGISHLDNFATTSVSVSAVPEPSTYAALLGFAALGLAGGRRGRLTRA